MKQTQLVNAGIDTVKINVKLLAADGTPPKAQALPESLVALLQAWQDEARENGKPLATSMTFHDARMLMLPNGAQAWKYLIKNDCIQLAVGARLSVPMIAKVTCFSSYLWDMGHVNDAIDEVHAFLMDVFGPDLFLQAAQLDLCVDVVGLHLPSEWEQVFITHALKKSPIVPSQKDRAVYRGRTLETVTLSGHGGPISCKLYNKVIEIKQHSAEKTWFHDIWKKNGWDGKTEVWRVEFSLERAGLHEMDLEDIYHALRNLKRIWAYCTQDWLRMVTPGQSKNRTRWKTAPLWTQIQGAFDEHGCPMQDALGPLVRERKRQVNIEQGVAALAGYATTLAAWCDQELEPDADAQAIFTLIYEKVLERWQRQQILPQDVVREKKVLYSRVG